MIRHANFTASVEMRYITRYQCTPYLYIFAVMPSSFGMVISGGVSG